MKNFQKLLVPVALLMCGVAYAQFPSVLKLVKSVIIPDSNIVFSVSNKAPKTDAEWAAKAAAQPTIPKQTAYAHLPVAYVIPSGRYTLQSHRVMGLCGNPR